MSKRELPFNEVLRLNNKVQAINAEQSIYLVNLAFKSSIGTSKKEKSFAVLLDENNIVIEIIHDSTGSSGSVDFRWQNIALRGNKIGAKKLVMVHTHPDYSIIPSKTDINTVMFLKSYFNEWNIELIDSCILSNDNKYYSMAEGTVNENKIRKNKNIKFYSIYEEGFENKFLNFLMRNLLRAYEILETKFNQKFKEKNIIKL